MADSHCRGCFTCDFRVKLFLVASASLRPSQQGKAVQYLWLASNIQLLRNSERYRDKEELNHTKEMERIYSELSKSPEIVVSCWSVHVFPRSLQEQQ